MATPVHIAAVSLATQFAAVAVLKPGQIRSEISFSGVME